MKRRLVNKARYWLPNATTECSRLQNFPQNLAKSCSAASHCTLTVQCKSSASAQLNSHWRAYSSSATSLQPSLDKSEKDLYGEFRNNKDLGPRQWDDLEKEVVQTHSRLDQELCQRVLRDLINNHEQFPPVSTPEVGPTGIWSYQSQHDPNHPERMLYTRHSMDGDGQIVEELVLDLGPNDQVLSMSLSVDESMIAYLVKDGSQSRSPTLRIRHVESGSEVELPISHETTGDLAAVEFGPKGPNGDHMIYLLGTDAQGRPDRVLASTVAFNSNTITTPNMEPIPLYQSNDPAVMVDVQRTKGCQYVAIRAMTKTASEIFLTNGTSLITVIPRSDNLQYHVDVSDQGDVYILAGGTGKEFRLLQANVADLPLKPYEIANYEIVASDTDIAIYDIDIFQDHLVTYERSKHDGLQRIRVHSRHNKEPPVVVPLPIGEELSTCCQLSPGGNMCFASNQLCFKIETPVNAGGIFTFDFDTHQVDCIGDSMPTAQAYGFGERSERVLVPSEDGTMVPLTLVYRDGSNGRVNNMNKDDDESLFGKLFGSFEANEGNHQSPTNIVLIAYGSYGEPIDLQYNPWHAMLAQRGYILAFAHTRGGGDLGREWYAKGSRTKKINAIEDLEACARYLRHRYYGTSGMNGKLTAATYSAGGVLVAAAINRHPDLFDNVILTNAFLDVYQTLKNPDLYLTQHEWDEFGSPLHSEDSNALIQSYCPIANLKFMPECPNALIIGTVDDENVPFWNAVIYAKTLRECIHDKDRVHLHLETGGHHLMERRIHVSALEMAFIIQQCEGKEEDAELW